MQRVTASLLIALVALMALLPQAMCPCSLRARAQATRAAQTPAATDAARGSEAPCCRLCRARAERTKSPTAGTQPRDDSRAPEHCPCCSLNGQGKHLVLRGDEVKPPEPAFLELVALLAAELGFEAVVHDVASRPVVPDVAASPPAELRAGVVLLI